VVESLRVPARRRPTGGRAERLLPHVLESTGHAQRLRAVPDLAVRLLTTAADELRDAGELDTSRPALERALAIAQAQLGSDHPDTLAARAGLAYILGEAGQPAQAADQYRDLFNDYLRVLGPDHPQTIMIRAYLAYYLSEAEQPTEAANQYRDLFNDYLRVLGPDHPNTIITHGNLAYMLGEAGQPAQAANLYRDLLNDRLRVLGPDHPDTLTARGMLAYWEDKQKADNG
jgi:hypothetical protein